jgi:hypothetical protein
LRSVVEVLLRQMARSRLLSTAVMFCAQFWKVVMAPYVVPSKPVNE